LVDQPDAAALVQIAWMVGACGLAIWCRVYPSETAWPQLSSKDADLLLVWGAALSAAAMLIRLLKRRVIDVHQRLAVVVECSPDAVMGVDRDGRLTVWSAGAERLFGYTSSEAVGQPMSLLVPPEHEDEQRAIVARVVAGEQIDRLLAERVRKDGSHVRVSLAVAPIRDAAGRVSGTSCMARDLTAEADARRRVALQAQVLIDEVLVISRIESGNLGISVEPVLLADGVQETLDLVRPIAAQHGVVVDADLSPVTDAYVLADLQRLKQVLLNLLSNAIKYNRPNGLVHVSAAAEGETVARQVTDTGAGIATEDLPRLGYSSLFDRLGAEASEVEGLGQAMLEQAGTIR
jgi:PAS domain S-box-containing protein